MELARRLQLPGAQPLPQEMALRALALLLLLPPSFLPHAAGCPAACRCYSTTVECGALQLRVVPPGVPPGTQVGAGWGRGRPGWEGEVCEVPVGERGAQVGGGLPRQVKH